MKKTENFTRSDFDKLLSADSLLFELAPLPYFILSSDGTFLRLNHFACELFSRYESSLIGQSFVEIHLGDSGDPSSPNQARWILDRLKTGKPIRGKTLEMVRPNGTHFWARLSSRPMQLGNKPIQHLVQVDEMTEDELRNKALKEGDRRFWDLFEYAPDATFVTDHRGNVLLMNARSEQVFGIVRRSFVNRPFFQLFEDEERPRLREIFERFLTQNTTSLHLEESLFHARNDEGDVLPIAVHLSKLEWDRENYVMASLRDMSYAQEMKQELIELNQELKREKEWFSAVFKDVPYAMLIGDLDQNVREVNPFAETLFGYSSQELVGSKTKHLYVNPEDYHQRRSNNFNPSADRTTEPYIVEYRRKDGSTFYGETIGTSLLNADGKPFGLLGVVQDVSDRLEAQWTLEKNEKQFREMTEGLNVVFWLADVWPTEPNREKIVYVSSAYEQVWGNPTEQLYRNPNQWFESIHPDDQARVRRGLEGLRKGKSFNEQFRIELPDGEIRWIHDRCFVVRESTGPDDPIRTAGYAEDITRQKQTMDELHEIQNELKKQNKDLESQVRRDPLTGLANRRAYRERLKEEWNRCIRNQSPLSLIMVDIDFFKEFNDSYGHVAGDELLQTIGELLEEKGAQRAGDSAVRYGGEEFLLILPDTDSTGARKIAESLRQEILSQEIEHGGSPINNHLTASFGIATTIPTLDDEPSTLFKEVDKALYRAKNAGRNQVCTA